MKRIISGISCLVLMLSMASLFAYAQEGESSAVIEYLPDGSYYITEIIQNSPMLRATKSGSKTATYYNSADKKIFSVKVTGAFTYSSTSAKATSSTATVSIYDSSASFVSKDAYTSGASAVASGKVKCAGNTASKSVTLTCSKSGVLS